MANRETTLTILGTSLILIFFALALPFYVGFSTSGFADRVQLDTFILYGVIGTGLLVALLIAKFTLLTWLKNDRYGDNIYFVEKADFLRGFSHLQIFLYSLILFLILGFVLLLGEQQAFLGIPAIQQQSFSNVNNILFSVPLVTVSENVGAAFFLAIGILIAALFAVRYNLSTGTYNTLSITLGGLAFMSYAIGLHLLRYGANEYNMFQVGLFWVVGLIMTIVSHNIWPFLAFHAVNNLAVKLRELFAADVAVGIYVAILVALIAFVVVFYRGRLLGRKV